MSSMTAAMVKKRKRPKHALSLPGPFRTPPRPDGIHPSEPTQQLVRREIRGLLHNSPGYRSLGKSEQKKIAHQLVRIASYAAECGREIWYHSRQMGQKPLVQFHPEKVTKARPLSNDFQSSAADRAGDVTRSMLRALSFPEFVTDLIRGTFRAITESNIQQMEAYGQLLVNVGKTVDQFMNDNITDNQARDWLAQSYPRHLEVRDGRIAPREGADELPPPNWQGELNTSSSPGMDSESLEENVVPAARRKLAETRLQMLSTLVLMGVNRIIVTGGKIRATMSFHIDTSDRMHQERASDLDFRTGASGSVGFGPWSASASMSFAYVKSTRQTNDNELNTSADMTGEVDIRFKSDYFPLSRFASSGAIENIRNNTAVPESNNPSGESLGTVPGNDGPSASDEGRLMRRQQQDPSYRPIGSELPEVREPNAPEPPPLQNQQQTEGES